MSKIGDREGLILFEVRCLEAEKEKLQLALVQEQDRSSVLDTQNKALSAKINQLSHALSTQTFEISKRKSTAAQNLADLGAARGEAARLQRDCSSLKARCATLETRNESAAHRYREAFESLKSHVKELKEETEKRVKLQERVELLGKNSRELSIENEALKAALDAARGSCTRLEEDSHAQQAHCEYLTQKITELEADQAALNDAHQQLLAAEKTRLARFDPDQIGRAHV